jgi:hypothetical protein
LKAIGDQIVKKYKEGSINTSLLLEKEFAFAIKDHLPNLNGNIQDQKPEEISYE